MQDSLFDDTAPVDHDADPYDDLRAASRRIADDCEICPDEAFKLLLGFGSEFAVRRHLDQRWWLSKDEEEPARAA